MSGFWAGYRAAADLGPSPTLTEVWQDAGGVFLFLGRQPSDFAAFDATLKEMLPRLAPGGGLRVLWLANPEDSPGYWQMKMLFASATGAGGHIAWAVQRPALFPLGGYAVEVRRGAALTQAAAALGYGIAVDATHVSFLAPGGGFPA
ncbi:MAG TPA: hypothetical protein VIP46_07580, partial [Pyrinomonadaceae bacterium]